MDEPRLKELYAEIRADLSLNYELTPEQSRVFLALLAKKDVCAVLPTGSGKSLLYAIMPLVYDKLYPENKPHTALVVTPLRALMKDQHQRWSQQGIRIGCILPPAEMTPEQTKGIVEGGLSVILTSPESVLSFGQKWREMLRSKASRKHICLLAFDEAHCITNWGDDFRHVYSQVGELRSMLGSVTTLVMSATLPITVREAVFNTLHLDPSTVTSVCKNPDRPNIFLRYEKRVRKSEESLHDIDEPQWLVDYVQELKRDGSMARKAIIYCRYINTVAQLWGYIMHALGNSAWVVDQSKKPTDRIVDMYHSSLDVQSQDRVVTSFTSDGVLRCVVSTIAFGMGIDVKDVRMVFHWGLPKSSVDYWQEIGRCARDGKEGEAVLYPAPMRGHVQTDPAFKSMIADINSQQLCIRKSVLNTLWLPEMGTSPLQQKQIFCTNDCGIDCQCTRCQCCSVCEASCPCQEV